MNKKYGKPVLLAGIICLILVLDHCFGWSAYLGDLENMKFLTRVVQENLLLAAAIYTVLTIVGCVVLALPGITFAVFAGLLFGPWLGTLLCLMATTIGAVFAFLAGRFFLRDAVKPLVMKNKWLKKVLFDETGRSDIVLLLITRLVPLFPYNLQNFAYGITDMPLATYCICTFFFMAPGVALFTIGSAGLAAEENKWVYFAASAVLLASAMLLGGWIRKKFMENSAEREV